MIPWYVAIPTAVAVLALVEYRLRAMKDLFTAALLQRESFEAMVRPVAARVEDVSKRLDNVIVLDGERDRWAQEHEKRIEKLEGKRLSPA